MATPRFEERRLVGGLLREIRMGIGLRQRDVADRLGVPQSFVRKYESGERYLGVIEVRAVCATLGISLAAFITELELRLGAPDA